MVHYFLWLLAKLAPELWRHLAILAWTGIARCNTSSPHMATDPTTLKHALCVLVSKHWCTTDVWICLQLLTSFLYWFISILLLFAVLLLRLPVPPGTCAHPDIECAAAQYETPGGGRGVWRDGAGWDGVCGLGSIVQLQQQDSLCSLQREDGEDGPPVHPSHAWAVAHELQQDGAALRAHLKDTGNRFTLTLHKGRGGQFLRHFVCFANFGFYRFIWYFAAVLSLVHSCIKEGGVWVVNIYLFLQHCVACWV